MNTQHVGTVKLYRDDRGFGFLKCDQGGLPDVFVHASAVKLAGMARLEAGQRVGFDIEANHKGHKAINLTILDQMAAC